MSKKLNQSNIMTKYLHEYLILNIRWSPIP